MIKGIVGYRVRSDADAQPLLRKLTAHAMQYPGFISAETLVSDKDFTVIALASTWKTVDNWKTWQESSITRDLLHRDQALLLEEPRVTTYRIMPAIEWR
ncbi:MAG: antibiotic biosynthesis monooxygenase family protein [Dehalococcoidia bacterium]